MKAKPQPTSSSCRGLLWVAVVWFCSLSLLHAERERPTTLPQDYAYQVVLRDYLATLTEADFEVELKPVTIDVDSITDPEELHRLWLLFNHSRLQSISSWTGLTIAPDNFVLDNIETDEGIMMRAAHRGGMRIPGFTIQPADTAWWALWDHQGNPYRGSEAVLNRAFVVAAVDMIMLDHLHESGTHWVANARRTDYLGGTMIWLGYIHAAMHDRLPPEVLEAYETGLEKFLDRMTQWGPTGVNDNMDMKGNVGLAYIGRTLPDSAMAEKARTFVQRNLNRIHSSGMSRDGGGLDASYSGIALVNIIWAAQVSQWPELIETVERMHDLKNHLTLPEPDGRHYFGPSHFSTRTAHGSPTDQWSQPYRDPAAAMLTDEAIYLLHGGRSGRGPRDGFPPVEQMRPVIERWMNRLNERLEPSDERFTIWEAGWWPGRVNYAHDYYRDGFYGDLEQLEQEGSPLLISAFSQPDHTFIRVFPAPEADVPPSEKNTFMVTRFDDYGAIAYTGPIGRTRYMNFAGGSLSAFWTKAGGSIIFGRTGHPVHPDRTMQTWDDWRVWPTHALSGTTSGGNAFSSARIRRRMLEVDYTVSDDSGQVRVSGPIGSHHDGGRTTQAENVHGEVAFHRELLFEPSGVVVESALVSDGKDTISELYEILPLHIQEMQRQSDVHHAIYFQVDGDWIEGTAESVKEVTAVRVERFEGGALIEFATPRTVRLSPQVWESSYQNRTAVRNLMIDLLDSPESESGHYQVLYRIRSIESGEASEPLAAADDAGLTPDLPGVVRALNRGSDGLPFLREIIDGSDRRLQESALRGMARGDEASFEVLLDVMRVHPDFATRHLAMVSLVEAGALEFEDLDTHLRRHLTGADEATRSALALLDWRFMDGPEGAEFFSALVEPDFEEGVYTISAPLLSGNARWTDNGEETLPVLELPGDRGNVADRHAISIPHNLPHVSPGGAFSVELSAWIDPQMRNDRSFLIDKFGAGSIGRDYNILLHSVRDDCIRLRASLGVGAEGMRTLSSDHLPMEMESWNDILLSYDGEGLARLFWNGEQVAKAEWTEGPHTIEAGTRNLTIGDRSVSHHRNFIGRIKGVRLHHHAIKP